MERGTMIAAFVFVIALQMAGFMLIFWSNAKRYEAILNMSLSHLQAKNLEEVVQMENLQKSYAIQRAVMKDNIAKEAKQLEQRALVKDELSGQMVDLSQYDIL
jgi:hypothetical protein